MLVCSCNFISDHEIRDVIVEMLNEDPWQLIVPAKVYHAMEKRGRCCGCFPNVVNIIVDTTERYHREHTNISGEKVVDFLERLRKFSEEQKAAINSRRISRVA